MKSSLICFAYFLVFSIYADAQADTIITGRDSVKKDSARLPASVTRTDSNHIVNPATDSLKTDSAFYADSLQQAKDSLNRIRITAKPKATGNKQGELKTFTGKEALFYYILFLLLLMGIMRRVFSKYFSDLFRVFFQTTLKQKQIREQLLQTPLPSVLMNFFFVLSTGLYINLVLHYFGLSVTDNFWIQYIYCSWALGTIYLVKYFGLQITGWIFNVRELINAYTFVVFLVNKVIGIFILVFLVLISFTQGPLNQVVMTLSWMGVGILLIYRFILSYGVTRNQIKFNPFHFLLYIIAFEVIPLLLIYKMLLLIF